MSGPKQINMI